MNFTNKTILITGASTGIGKALAEQLLTIECNLILVARRPELIHEYINKLQITNHQPVLSLSASGGRVEASPVTNHKPLVIKCDVSKKEEVLNACKEIKLKHDHIDVAILNAGIGHEMKVEKYNSELAEDIFGANVLGMINWIEQLLPDMMKRRNGIIAGVSSLADNRGYSGSGFYCASKAAATIYLEGLRVELMKYEVKVVTVRPGFVRTPMTNKNKFKMPFLMEPDKAAKIILRGIEKDKRVIQFPWQMVLLTRLVGLLPGSFYEWMGARVQK